MSNLPQVGDIVSILVPGNYQRFGKVIDTDYNPFGLHDAVKIQFENEIGNPLEWWSSRWVMKEPKEAHDG